MRRGLLMAALAVLLAFGIACAAPLEAAKKRPPGPPPTPTPTATPTPTPTPEPPPPPPPVTATKTVAVVLFNFTNDQTQPWTALQARGYTFDGPASAAAFYLEASYGKQTLVGDVFGWWTVPYTNEVCQQGNWKNAAREIAAGQGVNLDGYDHIALAFPYVAACQFNAYGGTDGSYYNGSLKTHNVMHELGHAFLLNHAKSLRCTDAAGAVVMFSTACAQVEYGDLYDTMGWASQRHHFNGWAKAKLGWLTSYTVVTASGRYTVAPLEWDSAGASQLLLIRRSDGTVLALDFRQPYGCCFDAYEAGSNPVGGVMVRLAPSMPWEPYPNPATPPLSVAWQTFLLDANPDGSGDARSPAMLPGQAFVDPRGDLTVTVASVSATGAVVDVAVG